MSAKASRRIDLASSCRRACRRRAAPRRTRSARDRGTATAPRARSPSCSGRPSPADRREVATRSSRRSSAQRRGPAASARSARAGSMRPADRAEARARAAVEIVLEERLLQRVEPIGERQVARTRETLRARQPVAIARPASAAARQRGAQSAAGDARHCARPARPPKTQVAGEQLVAAVAGERHGHVLRASASTPGRSASPTNRRTGRRGARSAARSDRSPTAHAELGVVGAEVARATSARVRAFRRRPRRPRSRC